MDGWREPGFDRQAHELWAALFLNVSLGSSWLCKLFGKTANPREDGYPGLEHQHPTSRHPPLLHLASRYLVSVIFPLNVASVLLYLIELSRGAGGPTGRAEGEKPSWRSSWTQAVGDWKGRYFWFGHFLCCSSYIPWLIPVSHACVCERESVFTVARERERKKERQKVHNIFFFEQMNGFYLYQNLDHFLDKITIKSSTSDHFVTNKKIIITT